MPQWSFINDGFRPAEEALLPVQDLAVQRGYGIFDYIRVSDGVPLFMEAHVDRLIHSSTALRIRVPFSKEELYALLQGLIERNGIGHSGIRITVTGGTSPDGFSIVQPTIIITEQSFKPVDPELSAWGIKLVTHEHQRQLASIKTIDYLMAIWLGPVIQASDADDVLYHSAGSISECPRSNFFLLHEAQRLVTPADGILPGITRKNIIACASELNVMVEERAVSLSELAAARGAFICSTTKGLLPVASIDGRPLETHHELFTALQAALAARIAQYKTSKGATSLS